MTNDLQQVIGNELASIKRDKDSLEVLASATAIATQNPDVLSTNEIIKSFAEDVERRVTRLEELLSAAHSGNLAKVVELYVEIVKEGDRT